MGWNKEILDMWQLVSLTVFVLQNLAPSVMAVQMQCLWQIPPVLNMPTALLACGERRAEVAEIVFHSGKYQVSSHRAYQLRDTPTAWITLTCLVGVSLRPSLIWVRGGSEETAVLLEDSYITDTYHSAVYLRRSYGLLEPRPVAI